MKKILLILALALGCMACHAAGPTAEALLSSVASNLQRMKSITATYDIVADGHTQRGTLTVSGTRFALSSPGVAAWFDGKTQWTYSPRTAEVSVTEPTVEEQQQVNPFAILGAFRKNYAATYVACKHAGLKSLKLTARSPKADIRSAVVTVNPKTLQPAALTLNLRSGQNVAITIRSLRDGGALPPSTFKYDPRKHPGVEVVDLR